LACGLSSRTKAIHSTDTGSVHAAGNVIHGNTTPNIRQVQDDE